LAKSQTPNRNGELQKTFDRSYTTRVGVPTFIRDEVFIFKLEYYDCIRHNGEYLGPTYCSLFRSSSTAGRKNNGRQVTCVHIRVRISVRIDSQFFFWRYLRISAYVNTEVYAYGFDVCDSRDSSLDVGGVSINRYVWFNGFILFDDRRVL